MIHPLVKQLLTHLAHKRYGLGEAVNRAGYHPSIIYHWRSGRYGPGLAAFADVCDANGLELVLKERPLLASTKEDVTLAVLDDMETSLSRGEPMERKRNE